MLGSLNVQHFMDLPVKEGLKKTLYRSKHVGIPSCTAFYGLTSKRRPEYDLYIGRNMLGSHHVQHFMDLPVKEGLKMTCI